MLTGEWSDKELEVLNEQWFLGLTDREIGKLIDRSEKSVQAKRTQIHLTEQYHPERQRIRPRRSVGRTYSRAEEADLLVRFENREELKSIATRYGVTKRAIWNKVERLLLREEKRPLIARDCLCCRESFLSREPKSVRRRCNACNEAMNETGASFLTVY